MPTLTRNAVLHALENTTAGLDMVPAEVKFDDDHSDTVTVTALDHHGNVVVTFHATGASVHRKGRDYASGLRRIDWPADTDRQFAERAFRLATTGTTV